MQVVVFDTNVLISAIGWRGRPYKCVEMARNGIVCGVTCRQILEELREKLELKLSFSPDEVAETIADLLGFLHVVPIVGYQHFVPSDPEDNKIIECAVVSEATCIVTGDRKHLLPMTEFQGIQIIPPAEFLALFGPSSTTKME